MADSESVSKDQRLYYNGHPAAKGHRKTNSSETDKETGNQSVFSVSSPTSNRRDSASSFQLQMADSTVPPLLGGSQGEHLPTRNYSLYSQNLNLSYDAGARAAQFQPGHSQIPSQGLGTYTVAPNVAVPNTMYNSKPPSMSGGNFNMSNFSFVEGQYGLSPAQQHVPFDQLFGHRRIGSGNSVDSRLAENDLWTPNTTFSFPQKSPNEKQFISPTLHESPQRRILSGDKVTKQTTGSPKTSLTKQFSPYKNTPPIPHQQSTTTRFSIEEAQRQYLEFYGDAACVLGGVMRLESVCDDIEKFTHFIKHDEQMKRFLAMERQKDIIGTIDPDTYSVEEFYKYLRQFPRRNLVNLRSIFESAKHIIDDWLKIQEEQERQQIPLRKWITSSASSDSFHSVRNLGFDVEDPFIHSETSAMRSSVSKPFYKSDTATIPGESVSMQVEPLRATNFVNQSGLYPKGRLQPDLSFKAKTVCLQCGSDKTPEWRKGPDSVPTLCNACGLFYNKLTKKYGGVAAEEELERRKRDGEPTNRKLYLQTETGIY